MQEIREYDIVEYEHWLSSKRKNKKQYYKSIPDDIPIVDIGTGC